MIRDIAHFVDLVILEVKNKNSRPESYEVTALEEYSSTKILIEGENR